MPDNFNLGFCTNFYEGVILLSIHSFFCKPLPYLTLIISLLNWWQKTSSTNWEIQQQYPLKDLCILPESFLLRMLLQVPLRKASIITDRLSSLDDRISGWFQTIQEEFSKEVSEPDTEDSVLLLWKTYSGAYVLFNLHYLQYINCHISQRQF